MGSRTSERAGIVCSSAARRRWLHTAAAAAALHCSLLAPALWLAAGTPARAQGATPPASAAVPRTAAGKTLLVVGDSLSAEYGLARGQGWVALLQKRLAQERVDFKVVNASISGDTTSGGRSRLPALLREHRPQVVVLELGGNDALRGLPLAMTEANLLEMARRSKAAGARVLVAGMAVPPNYGRSYGESFMALFPKVARAEGAALVPFMLAGVADGPEAETLFQPDRIHPKAEAHPRILDNIWPALKPLLR
ncbi:MAG: arylesterase [Burkholderiales bacterium]|nr:arylesterase [Burkholderiales bacterium]